MKIKLSVFLLAASLAAVAQRHEGDELQAIKRAIHYAPRPMPKIPNPTVGLVSSVVPTIPTWQGTDGSYTFQMIGANPQAAGAGTTSIPTNVVPLAITFADGTNFDPTAPSSCSSGQSPQSLVLSSPIFNNFNYTVNGVNVGNTQYPDFFQRANFWKFTSPAGVSPNYHTLLNASPVRAINIAVPAAKGSTVGASTTSAPCGKLGLMDVIWFDAYLQSTVFPQLASLGVLPANFTVFVLSNVAMYQDSTANCCILGFHSGFNNPNFSNANQTYAVGDFETSGSFSTLPDIASLSHEIGEWMDDPSGNNPTPPWGHIGQITGCMINLEVGDPLSGMNIAVTMSNAFTYHVQELAFKSWFYHDAPSWGVNGWYSSNGTFKSYAAACQTSATTLAISPATVPSGNASTIKISVTGSGTGTIPTGKVTIVASNNSTPLATYTLSSGSVSASAILPAGSYSVSAQYAGDANFGSSSSAAVAVMVTGAVATLSPTSLAFASQAAGTSSSSKTVKLTNSGSASLAISGISVTGTNTGDFTQTNNCGGSLAPSANCTITVVFKPTATGARSAWIAVADNAPASPQIITLSGTGAAPPAPPSVTVSQTSLTFPSTVIGVASSSQSVTLTNTSAVALSISSTSITGNNASDFSRTTTCGTSLAAGASCTFAVTFKPTLAGARTASLSIVDNALNTPQVVTLTGTGVAVPAVTLSASSIKFASTKAGVTAAPLSVTLTSSGSAALSITAVSIAGTNAADFTQTNTCGASLAAGASCTISVKFKPAATGTRAATLRISDNAVATPQTVALLGTGK